MLWLLPIDRTFRFPINDDATIKLWGNYFLAFFAIQLESSMITEQNASLVIFNTLFETFRLPFFFSLLLTFHSSAPFRSDLDTNWSSTSTGGASRDASPRSDRTHDLRAVCSS
jgi:hypothetical protein